MPRWTSCFIDKRAISHKGQWGQYKCEKCGKIFPARMCTKKKVKHIFCSTKCKKDYQVNYSRNKISDNVYRYFYDKYYELVKICAFEFCHDTFERTYLEDCMQYGFLELWHIYNRNKFNCSKKYIRKSISHSISDNMRYKFSMYRKERENTIYFDRYEDMDELLYTIDKT